MEELLFSFGIVNIDFADIKEIMKNSGYTIFNIGKGFGKNKVEEAAKNALNLSSTKIPLKGAQGVLFNIFSKGVPSLVAVNKAAEIITKEVSPLAKIIFGVTKSKKLKKDEAKILIIITGIKEH